MNHVFLEQMTEIQGNVFFPTFHFEEKFELEEICEIKEFEKDNLIIEECVWGAKPLKHTFQIQSWKSQILWFHSFLQTRVFLRNESLERGLSLEISVILLQKNVIHRLVSDFFHFVYFDQNQQILKLTSFWLKIMLIFKWPEIGKYLSDRSEPKCGNGKKHFNFAFSLVKFQNFSYFARYSRELTYRSWLGTP